MPPILDNPLYYLDNFHRVLACIGERYSDLLSEDEQAFITHFTALPRAPRALLVRMLMRKGDLFRASKLAYVEIGDPLLAAAPLVRLGWLDDRPLLSLDALFGLLKKSDWSALLDPGQHGLTKARALETLRPRFGAALTFADWLGDNPDVVYQVRIRETGDRLRLMFFGNLDQDWSTFVLADLGLLRYEKVAFCTASRGFACRQDVDLYAQLHAARERLRQGEPPEAVLAAVPTRNCANPWLEGRRAKLLFRIARAHERLEQWPAALALYSRCHYPGARVRTIRVLERSQQYVAALHLAQTAAGQAENETEAQLLLRIIPRLQRALGLVPQPKPRAPTIDRLELHLPRPEIPASVEQVVRDHLSAEQAPVHYVENGLIPSLLGLLCWQPLFAALPGAFFHAYHRAPVDLLSADFYPRRAPLFAQCFAQLESGQYRQTIRQHFREKAGLQSPFVAWGLLSEALLELALACIPAAHLKACFVRILQDIQANRSGLPDLIQFWPDEGRYQMIEVKGPGDRLQDNQRRWLDYCVAHAMPVSVCQVRWLEHDGP
ncbi:MAG: VRR-NUC domain-containing protein [Pseudomonadota bacterium]